MSQFSDDDYAAVQRHPDDPFNPPDPVEVFTRQRDTARRQRDEAEGRERKLRQVLAQVTDRLENRLSITHGDDEVIRAARELLKEE